MCVHCPSIDLYNMFSQTVYAVITFLRTPSAWLASFSRTGARNFANTAWSCSSLSAEPSLRNTRSSNTAWNTLTEKCNGKLQNLKTAESQKVRNLKANPKVTINSKHNQTAITPTITLNSNPITHRNSNQGADISGTKCLVTPPYLLLIDIRGMPVYPECTKKYTKVNEL